MTSETTLGRLYLTAPAPRDLPWWIPVVVAVAMGLLSLHVRGYSPSLYNGTLHVPLMRQHLDPTLYPNDLLLEAHRVYPSILWDALCAMAPLVGLKAAMLGGFLLQQILLHLAVTRLVWRLGASPLALVVANVFALLTVAPGLGGSQWSIVSLTHTTMSFPVLVLALEQVLGGRWIAAACLWSLGMLIHAPNGVFAAPGMMGAIWAVWHTSPELRPSMRRAAVAMAVAVVGGGIAVGRIWLTREAGGELTMDQLRVVLRNPVGYHVFIGWHLNSVESMRRLLTFVLQMAIAVCMLGACRGDRRLWMPVAAAIGGSLAFILLSLISTELFELVSLANLMRLRAADILHFLLMVVPLAMVGRWAAGELPLNPLGVAPFVAAFFLGSTWWAGNPEGTGLALLVLVLARACPEAGAAWLTRRGTLQAAVAASLLLVAAPAMMHAVRIELAERHYRRLDSETGPWAKSWLKMQKASNKLLPKNAMVLTPPHNRGWRARSLHSPYLELSDCIGVILNPRIWPEYERRARLLGYDMAKNQNWEEDPSALYGTGTGADFLRLMRAEGLRYAVVYWDTDVPGATVLKNDGWLQLIDIGPPATAGAGYLVAGASGS